MPFSRSSSIESRTSSVISRAAIVPVVPSRRSERGGVPRPTTRPGRPRRAAAPKRAAAERTKPAAAAPAVEPTKPAAAAPATAPAAAPTQAPAPAAPAAATKPSSSIKINGNLQIIQSRSFNPIQTTFQHNLLLREAAARGWPLDKTYIEGFTSGTNIFEKLQAQASAGDSPDMIVGGIDTFQLWNLNLVEAVDDVVQWAEQQFGKT